MPSPMKNRRMEPGCQIALADALALGLEGPDAAVDAAGFAGSPLLMVAAAAAGDAVPAPSWRRATAAAAQIAGAAAGESPFPPKPNHDNRVLFNPVAVPVLGAAVMTGAVAAAGAATGAITAAEPTLEAPATMVDGSALDVGTGALSIAPDSRDDEPAGVETSAVGRPVGRLVVALASELPDRW